MDKHQDRQRKKNEALNKIRKLHNPRYEFPCSEYDSDSCSEQRDYAVSEIISKLEKDLNAS